jgi:predicted transposase YdaD
VPERGEERSQLGWTSSALSWRVVELWTLPAEEPLAAPNVGVVPWVSLARYDGPPTVLLRRCRDRLESEGGAQRANLLAVAQVFARLHFDRPEWLEILGGRQAMIESPLIQEIVAESKLEERVGAILDVLRERFGAVTPAVTAGLEQVKEKEKLVRLTRHAVACVSLQQFEERLREELPPPRPASTRGKRRSRKPPA